MTEYIEREAISEKIRKYYYKILRIFPMWKGLTVVLIERKEQYSTLQPPTLPRFVMGGGSKRKNTPLALCTIVLCAKTAFLTTAFMELLPKLRREDGFGGMTITSQMMQWYVQKTNDGYWRHGNDFL